METALCGSDIILLLLFVVYGSRIRFYPVTYFFFKTGGLFLSHTFNENLEGLCLISTLLKFKFRAVNVRCKNKKKLKGDLSSKIKQRDEKLDTS